MPVSNIWVLDSSWSNGGSGAVDAPPLLDLEGLALLEVEDVAGGVEHLAQGDVADRHRDGATRVQHRGAAHEPVGGLQRDGADHVVADVLSDLEVDVLHLAAELYLGAQQVVLLRDPVRRELDVDDRTGDPGDPAAGAAALLLDLVEGGECHGNSLLRSGQRVGTADDLADLLGDLGLAGLVGQPGVVLMRASALSVADFIARCWARAARRPRRADRSRSGR
jgi:hypothetical protein